MIWENIFGNAMSPTSSPKYYNLPLSESHQVLSERDGSIYNYGLSKKSKWQYKSDKKHAAMSALTLLAFLFFLNILQNCLREQTTPIVPEVTMMMMMPAPQKHIKDGTGSENAKEVDNSWQERIRKTRSILEFQEDGIESTTKVNRHLKFIHDLNNIRHNWANGLSQLSEEELENQRLKTDNFRSYLKRYPIGIRRPTIKTIPLMRNLSKLTNSEEESSDGKRPVEEDWVPKVGPVATFKNNTNAEISKIHAVDSIGSRDIRNSRSDITNTESQLENVKKYQNEVQSVTPSIDDLKTYKIYPVYHHFTRRYLLNGTMEKTTGAPSTTMSISNSQTTHSTLPPFTTELYPGMVPSHKYPSHNRFRFTSHYRYNQPRYPPEYRYSPHRRTTNYYEKSPGYHAHEEFYPVTVVRKPEDDEFGFDLIKFVWTMLSEVAKPLSRIVPGIAKDGNDEPQCYDLLICEAHRVSRLMGPTAEAVASTFSTILTWYTTGENRKILIEAVTSGRENTCQRQIRDCDERSGGKSALTVLAQVLETKLR